MNSNHSHINPDRNPVTVTPASLADTEIVAARAQDLESPSEPECIHVAFNHEGVAEICDLAGLTTIKKESSHHRSMPKVELLTIPTAWLCAPHLRRGTNRDGELDQLAVVLLLQAVNDCLSRAAEAQSIAEAYRELEEEFGEQPIPNYCSDSLFDHECQLEDGFWIDIAGLARQHQVAESEIVCALAFLQKRHLFTIYEYHDGSMAESAIEIDIVNPVLAAITLSNRFASLGGDVIGDLFTRLVTNHCERQRQRQSRRAGLHEWYPPTERRSATSANDDDPFADDHPDPFAVEPENPSPTYRT